MPASPSTWMTDNYDAIQNRPFSKITLLGSHDSGTSTLSQIGGSVPTSADITQAQGLSIQDQIVSAGVRYLDLRLVNYSAPSGNFPSNPLSGYYAAHYSTVANGYVGWLGLPLSEIISQLGAAVQAIGAKEILLIELSHGIQLIDVFIPEYGVQTSTQPLTSAQLDEIANTFAQDQTLGPYLYQSSSPVNFWDLTPSDFNTAESKPNVFVFAGANTATGTTGGPIFQKPACADYYSPGTGCSTDDPTSLISQLAQNMQTNLLSGGTPYLLAYHCTGQPLGPSLQDLAGDLDPVFQDSLALWCGQSIIDQAVGRQPVIMTADWVSDDTSILLDPCIGMNYGQYQGIVSIAIPPGQTCKQGPAMAWLNGVPYVAWAGTGHGNLHLGWSTDGGATYNTWPSSGTSGQSTDQSPALCVSGDTLYLVWTGTHDTHPYVAEVVLNGSAVEKLNSPRVFNQPCAHGSAIASLNGVAYLAWTDSSGYTLKVMNLTTGSVYDSEEKSEDSPALCVFDGNLWIAWKGSDGNVSVGQLALAGTTASIINPVDLQQGSKHGPALASVEGAIYVAWVGGNTQLNVISSADGQNFGSQYLSIQQSGASPALCASDQGLCLAWGGVNTGGLHIGNYTTS
jgi:hypothetical protein